MHVCTAQSRNKIISKKNKQTNKAKNKLKQIHTIFPLKLFKFIQKNLNSTIAIFTNKRFPFNHTCALYIRMMCIKIDRYKYIVALT